MEKRIGRETQSDIQGQGAGRTGRSGELQGIVCKETEEPERCLILRVLLLEKRRHLLKEKMVEMTGISSEGSGGVAQLGEHLPCKQGVDSSNLFISTRGRPEGESDWQTATDMGS